MSYCRVSSNNWKCDLHCFPSSRGYITGVAHSRIQFHKDAPWIPDPEDFEEEKMSSEEYAEIAMKQGKALELSVHVPIGLSEDGKTFCDPDLASFLKRILWLKELGYRVPDEVIERIEEEISEERINYV